MAKRKARPRLTMLGTMRINLTFHVAQVQDAAGDSVYVMSRAVLDYLGIRKPRRCAWFSGSGHLCFLTEDEWELVDGLATDANVDLIPFDGVWELADDPECEAMDVYEWAAACCKVKHPRGKTKIQ
jgi:hypothetical protein